MHFSQGDSFYGMWLDGYRTVGKHIYEQGDVYIGWFSNDEFDDYGYYNGVNGIKFIGGWKEGK